MKAEMRNLLDRLKSHPNLEQFQNLIVFPSGQVSAVYRNGSLAFPDLDAVEKFAYPDGNPTLATFSTVFSDATIDDTFDITGEQLAVRILNSSASVFKHVGVPKCSSAAAALQDLQITALYAQRFLRDHPVSQGRKQEVTQP